MIERRIQVSTPDGEMQTFTCRPDGAGVYPVVLFLMDAPGVRDELRDMARRLAGAGYYVALPNLYYREGVMELGPLPRRAEGPLIATIQKLMNSLTTAMALIDIAALLAALDDDPAAGRGRVGCVGYCMSGPFAINAAARWPARFGATASVHGIRLVTDAPDSPHVVAARAGGRIYFACAEHDEEAPLDEVAILAARLKADGANGEVEVYPGVEHGFAFSQRDAYDAAAAERCWSRLLEMFDALG
jgi:carboxymethylenebutenolidase